MDDLVAFLKARLDERYENADIAHELGCDASVPCPDGCCPTSGPCDCGEPDRVRRQVEFLRWFLADHEPKMITYQVWNARAMEYEPRTGLGCAGCYDDEYGIFYAWPCEEYRRAAAIFSDHPEYRTEWKP